MNTTTHPSSPNTGQTGGVTTWVRQPLGRLVTCALGTLWLRFDGEADAVVLEAGQSHRCLRAAPLAIHGSAIAALLVA
jgi:hypothetical protein